MNIFSRKLASVMQNETIKSAIFLILFSPIVLQAQAEETCHTCDIVKTIVSVTQCCGDGIRNGLEQCDGSDYTGQQKPAEVPVEVWDAKVCNPAGGVNECKYLLGPYCGDGIVNGDEECDGNTVAAVLSRPPGVSDAAWLSKTCNPPLSANACKLNTVCQYHAINYINNYFDEAHRGANNGKNVFSGDTNSACLESFFGADFNTATQLKCNGDYNNTPECMRDDSMLLKLFAQIRIDDPVMHDTPVYIRGVYSYDMPVAEKLRLLNLLITKTVDDTYTFPPPSNLTIPWWSHGNPEMDAAWSLVTDRDQFWTSIHNREILLRTPVSTPVATPSYQTPRAQIGWVFDENCKLVQEIESADLICGTTLISTEGSPISLDFSESKDDSEQNSWKLLQFNLNPNVKDSWVIWKASATDPLLVFDRKDTGKITDGSSLFGNWTFGGKNNAIIPISLGSTTQPQPWDDGYQPLSRLDTNQDGYLSGKELAHIYLWFDKNQNAKSEAAEIKSATKAGITKIFTKSDYKDPITGDIHAKLGYEMKIKGEIKQGASVDWYTKIYKTEADAQAELLDLAIRSKNSKAQSENTPSKVESEDSNFANNSKSSVAGGWVWGVVNENSSNVKTSGVFWFNEAEGKVSGFSLAELPLDSDISNGMKSILAKFPVNGSIDASGKLNFEVTKDNSPTTNSHASIDSLGFMVGKSETEIPDPSASGGKRKLSFSWKARRI